MDKKVDKKALVDMKWSSTYMMVERLVAKISFGKRTDTRLISSLKQMESLSAIWLLHILKRIMRYVHYFCELTLACWRHCFTASSVLRIA